MRSKHRMYRFTKQWQRDWLRITAIMQGFDEQRRYHESGAVMGYSLRKVVPDDKRWWLMGAPPDNTRTLFVYELGTMVSPRTLFELIGTRRKYKQFKRGNENEFFSTD